MTKTVTRRGKTRKTNEDAELDELVAEAVKRAHAAAEAIVEITELVETLSETVRDSRAPMLLTFDEAARELSVSRSTVYRFINHGDLRTIQLGPGMTRISVNDLQAMIADRAAGKGAA